MLTEKIISGDVRAVAKLIRRIDDGDETVMEDLQALYPHTGKAHIIGFTGSPGVGKSTLVEQIIARFRGAGQTVGVLAVDPTSPFTGGAILGDRVRMQKHFLDDGVFIRSMATRGSFGGLTRSTADAIVVLDAMGKDAIIIETVGVGQDEVDIAQSAHTTVMVTVPGMGDDIQAIKAGLMEIGDIFVVNKSDREGAAKTQRELGFMLQMSPEKHEKSGWMPPILLAQAANNTGIEEIFRAIVDHGAHLRRDGGERLRDRRLAGTARQLTDLLAEKLMVEAMERIGGKAAIERAAERIVAGEQNPYAASRDMVARVLGGDPP